MKTTILTLSLFCLCIFANKAQDSTQIKHSNSTNKEVQIMIKENSSLKLYIDEKECDISIFELLDEDKIASATILKDEIALKKYNAPNGVILVVTKKALAQKQPAVKIRNAGAKQDPLIIIDGKQVNQEALSILSPDDILSIDVLKDETALKNAFFFNAPNGVIIVTTKKGKNEK